MGHGDQVVGSRHHQIPTFCLCRACSFLSAEWQYICRMVPDVGPSLVPVENALCTKFLPALLGIDGPINDKLRTLLENRVKTGGLAIRDPTLAAASPYSTSVEATEML
ncbi:hypothetical protein ACHAW6_000070 [Cyclotella cf. meneghiniana]